MHYIIPVLVFLLKHFNFFCAFYLINNFFPIFSIQILVYWKWLNSWTEWKSEKFPIIKMKFDKICAIRILIVILMLPIEYCMQLYMYYVTYIREGFNLPTHTKHKIDIFILAIKYYKNRYIFYAIHLLLLFFVFFLQTFSYHSNDILEHDTLILLLTVIDTRKISHY